MVLLIVQSVFCSRPFNSSGMSWIFQAPEGIVKPQIQTLSLTLLASYVLQPINTTPLQTSARSAPQRQWATQPAPPLSLIAPSSAKHLTLKDYAIQKPKITYFPVL